LKLKKVILLHKKSTFQLQAVEHRESRFVKLLEENHEVVTRVKKAHSEHVDTLSKLEKELRSRNIDYKVIARSQLVEPIAGVDLMISVGGDGTFLDASHYTDTIPMLGVNSAQSSSFGHFCYANDNNFAEVLDKIISDEISPVQLMRLSLRINGKSLSKLALNEILVAHCSPAATSRYIISVGDIKEEQRSSGIWIATAAGSTGSLRSAGGDIFPITDERYQLIVREPCVRPKEVGKLRKVTLDPGQQIKLISQMRTGAIFVDGQHINYQFYLGDELLIKPSEKFLNVFVSKDVNDIFSD
jgi:NAD+ kinase